MKRMSNQSSNTIITNLRSELSKALQKAKRGWRSYFLLVDNYEELRAYVADLQQRNRAFRDQLTGTNTSNTDIDIDYLKSQFIDMYDRLQRYTQCPVCYEAITKENIEVPRCGHIICKVCVERIKETNNPNCPICTRRYS